MKKDILIRKYLYAELSKEETVEFNELLEDADFVQELEYRTVWYADKLTDFKLKLTEYVQQPLHKKVEFFLKDAMQQNHEFLEEKVTNILQYCNQFISKKHHAPAVMMNESSGDEDFMLAMEAFRSGWYEIAIDKLEKLVNDETNNEILLYVGLSYLYQTKPNYMMAAFYLRDVLEEDTPFKKEEAQWYIALCYLKMGEIRQAYETLEHIENSKAWKMNDATKLLNVFRH